MYTIDIQFQGQIKPVLGMLEFRGEKHAWHEWATEEQAIRAAQCARPDASMADLLICDDNTGLRFSIQDIQAAQALSIDLDLLHDFVTSHGHGAPSDDGIVLAKRLMVTGDDMATAAAEVVARELLLED